MGFNPLITAALGISEDELIRLVTADVSEVFTTMVDIDDVLHVPHVVDPVKHFNDCVTAMVGLAGAYNGMVSLHATHSLAMSFTSRMLGMEVTEIGPDVNDALGEIANMLAGSFKQHLTRAGNDVRLSTPSVVNGKEYVISVGNPQDTLTLLFDVQSEWFILSIVLETE
ncbi:chemotaxis protein CheX [Geobacter sp. SVR]|uniref:chemotaxis protein CheX n=1 Tax=Geobacter sp. SVR TaxID=2495594 RepID=UPI00143EFA87|nr:chemotaxis protein CheX [Geobacter sp. SVR]BCS54184.1 chemotaxis protein CheX [Geobacter sp. SVR]GCF85957.1 chemotaxis protein CheX [Geobacter sp. SVR]